MRFFILTAIMSLGVLGNAVARPISYPEGWTFMQTNDSKMNSMHVHYSPSIKYSVGYKAQLWRDDEWQFHGVQLNNLVKRWNKPQSQANLYIKSAIGLAYSDLDDDIGVAGFTGISADWENRRFFTMYENSLTYAGDIDKFFTQKARVGVAPYIGDYGDIHTWIMLQVDHNPKSDEELELTPLVRIFKDVYLFEVGVSNNKGFILNSVIRF